jgi:hypothetical protein
LLTSIVFIEPSSPSPAISDLKPEGPTLHG